MAAYDIQFADPGGEYYYSLGPSAGGVWGTLSGAYSCINNAAAGRASTYGLQLLGGGIAGANLKGNYAGALCGAAIYLTPGFSFSTPAQVILAAYDLVGGGSQVELRADGAGYLYFTRNGNNLGAGNPSKSTNALVAGSGWNYIEMKVVINGSTGSAEVRVNGVVWLTLTGINTQNTANAYCNQIRFQGGLLQSGGSFGGVVYKDMYVAGDTGTGPYTTYLGDVTVAVFYPNGAGVNSSWTPNGAASGWQCVDDGTSHSGTWPDGDTTYISSATAGQISDFSKPALSLTGSILAVIVASYMRKDDAGSRSAANTLLSGGTESDGATQSLGNTYSYYFDVYEKDPHTSAAWSLTGFNSMTFGVKEIS